MPSSVSTIETKQNLTADCWAEAALDAIAGGGLDAVAVEPLARRLGVTKGSFYWHFANRDALLRAALQRWEQTETDDIVARIGPESDPYVRIVKLLSRRTRVIARGVCIWRSPPPRTSRWCRLSCAASPSGA